MAPTHNPRPKRYPEKIGDHEYTLEEARLDVFDDIILWSENPRLQPFVAPDGLNSDTELEGYLLSTPGYDALRKNIADVGQMEPIYVWKRDGAEKYLVLEGATRATILRQLARAKQGQAEESRYRFVVAKILPEEFSIADRFILLARIHVRGSGVRGWGRYIEAKFVYDSVTPSNGHPPVMSVADLARHMGKSQSWVSRLKDAYVFGDKYVTYFDDADAHKEAVKHFSTLEEISKSSGFGPKVREYGKPDSDQLRNEVFEMVRSEVFQEYRDARFMKDFFDDPEKWSLLKTREKGIAHRLANDIKAGSSNVRAKISNLRGQIERALNQQPDSVTEDDLAQLEDCVGFLESKLTDIPPFRRKVRMFTQAVYDASAADVKHLTDEDLDNLTLGLNDVRDRKAKLTPATV